LFQIASAILTDRCGFVAITLLIVFLDADLKLSYLDR
jgi:hypothetical protein